jgi:hypothetical protein
MAFFRSVALIASIVVLISGCATVTRGSNEDLQIITTPTGAQVETSNGFSCASTPCAIKMPRRSELVVTISKPGCKTIQVNVSNETQNGGGAALAGNVLVGGVIGIGVDAATSASQNLVPNPINVPLECKRK